MAMKLIRLKDFINSLNADNYAKTYVLCKFFCLRLNFENDIESVFRDSKIKPIKFDKITTCSIIANFVYKWLETYENVEPINIGVLKE